MAKRSGLARLKQPKFSFKPKGSSKSLTRLAMPRAAAMPGMMGMPTQHGNPMPAPPPY